MPLYTTGRYRRAERRTGCQRRIGHRRADGVRHGFGVIAERPTGAGLTLGMGLRDIAAKPDGRCGEGGRLWSVAEPACPDGAASHLGEDGRIFEEDRNSERHHNAGPHRKTKLGHPHLSELHFPYFNNLFCQPLSYCLAPHRPHGVREDAGGYQSKLGFRRFSLASLSRLVQWMALFVWQSTNRQSHP